MMIQAVALPPPPFTVTVDGQCIQTILLPATSIWAVKALPNGDVATGSNDGVVRVFTRDPKRTAEEPTLKVLSHEYLSPSDTVGVRRSGFQGVNSSVRLI